ncbi:MAG: anthrone oxygenase family protein, partial [Planctomycetota bacterium]
MIATLAFYLAIATAVSAALVGGILFAFSTFIMPALARRPAAQAAAAMQAINETVYTPWVMVPFVGTGFALLALTAMAWLGAAPALGAPLHVSGATGLYVCGCILLTGTRNVPMNEHLATLEPTSDEAARYWPHYGSRWTAWNHLRTAACLLA